MIQHITKYYTIYTYELKPTDSNQRWVNLSQFESSTSRQPKKGNSLLLHTSDPNLDGWAEAGTACPQKTQTSPFFVWKPAGAVRNTNDISGQICSWICWHPLQELVKWHGNSKGGDCFSTCSNMFYRTFKLVAPLWYPMISYDILWLWSWAN